MKSLADYLITWFGYTRRDRRSTFMFLLIIIFILTLRYLVPGQDIPIEELPVNLIDMVGDTNKSSNHYQYASGKEKNFNKYRQKPILEINSCDSAYLEALPGIGPVLSSRIIRYRKLIGGFVSVDQLKEVYGLTEETFNKIRIRFYTDTTLIRKIKINNAEYKDIIKHPYIKKDEVSKILKYRQLVGRFKNLEEMMDNNIISPETERKIAPYLDFGN